jgi:hypothetical protein
MKLFPILLVLGLLASCGSTPDADGSRHALTDAARPEIRYYLVADT